MDNAFNLTVDDQGIAKLVFNLSGEKVNKLTERTMQEFSQVLDRVENGGHIRALTLFSGKADIFIAGADIDEIVDIYDPQDGARKASTGQAILSRLENLSIPTIAVIDGACLGGGLELALACTYRISTNYSKTSLGLPEVSLGIIPGFGGTQRLPRLIGLRRGVSMILSGKAIDGVKAYRYGVSDACVPREFLTEETDTFVRSILTPNGRKKVLERRRKGLIQKLISERNPISKHVIFKLAKKNLLKKTKGFYPAPLTALDVIKKTKSMNLSKGLKIEAEAFGKLVVTDISKNLVNLFFTSEKIKKDKGVNQNIEPFSVSRTGVLGAGVMGGGISWLFTKAQIPVRLKDLSWEAIGKGYQTASKIYKKLKQRGKYNDREIGLRMHLLSGTTDFSGFNQLDVVVEAVVENLKIKQDVFNELENHVRDDAIIATNTSTIPIPDMAKTLRHPERFIGMHFFNPVNRMPLVEVIPSEQTSPETMATIMALAKRLGKTPIKVQSCPGFLVNRLLLPYLNEAFYMLQEGINPVKIDCALCNFGMPMGPFTLVDKIGIDVGYKAATILHDAYGSRMKIAEVFSVFYNKSNRQKQRLNNEIYIRNGTTRGLNPDLAEILGAYTSKSLILSHQLSEEDIAQRAICTMLNEACYCLEENIVERPEYLDMALILGIGFPAFRGGLLRYADTVGISKIGDKIGELEYIHGERFKPSSLLLEMRKKKAGFYTNETIG